MTGSCEIVGDDVRRLQSTGSLVGLERRGTLDLASVEGS